MVGVALHAVGRSCGGACLFCLFSLSLLIISIMMIIMIVLLDAILLLVLLLLLHHVLLLCTLCVLASQGAHCGFPCQYRRNGRRKEGHRWWYPSFLLPTLFYRQPLFQVMLPVACCAIQDASMKNLSFLLCERLGLEPSAPTEKIKLTELREISTLQLFQELKPTNPRDSESPNLTIKESVIHPNNTLGGIRVKYLLCRWY